MKKILLVRVALALLAGCGGNMPTAPESTSSQTEQSERELQQLSGEAGALAADGSAPAFSADIMNRHVGTPVHAVLHRHGAEVPLRRLDRALAYGSAGG